MIQTMQNSLDGSGKLWVGGAERSEVQQAPTLAADSKTGVDQSSVAALQKKPRCYFAAARFNRSLMACPKSVSGK